MDAKWMSRKKIKRDRQTEADGDRRIEEGRHVDGQIATERDGSREEREVDRQRAVDRERGRGIDRGR